MMKVKNAVKTVYQVIIHTGIQIVLYGGKYECHFRSFLLS